MPKEISTRGVQEEITGDNTEMDIDDNEGHVSRNHKDKYDDDGSVANESAEDQHITINNISTMQEMDAGKLGMDHQTGEEMDE